MGKVIKLTRKAPEPDRVKLSKKKIDAFDYDPDGSSWQVIWDTEVENLGVRAGKTSKSYILRYRNSAGKRRCWTIGKTSKITIQQARKLAIEGNARIVLGEDPSMEKQQSRQEPDDDSFKTLARQWIDEYATSKRKSYKTDEARLLPDDEDKADAPIRILWAVRPGQDDRATVEDALRRVHDALTASTPVEADRVAQTVNTCLNWHVKRRNVSAAFKDIAEVIDFNGSDSREAYVRPSELSAFFKAVQARPLRWKAAIWLMLLTGSRSKSEVLSLRWSDVHLAAGEFTYTDTKNGKAHTLPLTPATRAIFDALPKKGTWVFPARRGDGPRQDSRKQFQKIRRAKFIDHITPHALRHTARTYLQTKLKLPGPTVDAILNHSTHGMAGVYTHVSIDDVRDALVELERFILAEAKIEDFKTYLTTKPT